MTEELLDHYKDELQFILRLGEEFSRNHPEVADGLGLGATSVQDPHVERLIKAFSLLTARVRRKLDDDFPELSQGLLNILYPNYLAPVPSVSLVELVLDRGATEAQQVERGSQLQTEPVDGEPCYFRTTYPTTLWPMEVYKGEFVDGPEKLLRFSLRSFDPGLPIRDLVPESEPLTVRFYLYDLAPYADAHSLYEHLLNDVESGQLITKDDDGDEHEYRLSTDVFAPVGFEAEDGLFPQERHALSPFRVLSDYFSFPAKYRFVDFTIPADIASKLGSDFDVTLTLTRGTPRLERTFHHESLRLGCTPIVNLFEPHGASVIKWNHTQNERRIVPDPRRPRAMEIYRIRSVVDAESGERFEPFLFTNHHYSPQRQDPPLYYSVRRGRARMCLDLLESSRQTDEIDHGTELYLSLIDLGFQPSQDGERTLHIETECLNRDLPSKLQFGGGRPRLTLSAAGAACTVQCLEQPTPTRRADLDDGLTWRLISQLSLKHLPLADPAGDPDQLREILTLNDSTRSNETRSRIESVVRLRASRTLAFLTDELASCYCRGTRIDLELDEERFGDNGTYLFATVLERFFSLYSSINSFTQLSATSVQRGLLRTWSPRSSTRRLL